MRPSLLSFDFVFFFWQNNDSISNKWANHMIYDSRMQCTMVQTKATFFHWIRTLFVSCVLPKTRIHISRSHHVSIYLYHSTCGPHRHDLNFAKWINILSLWQISWQICALKVFRFFLGGSKCSCAMKNEIEERASKRSWSPMRLRHSLRLATKTCPFLRRDLFTISRF